MKNFRFSSALGHGGDVNSVVITQNEKFLVSGSSDKTIKLWELVVVKKCELLKRHSSSVNSVVISADGKYIISGSIDKTIKLWAPASVAALREAVLGGNPGP